MFLGKLLRTGVVAAAVLAGFQLDAAADPITYDGTLSAGVTSFGDIGPGDPSNALQADYWRFWATAGDNVTVITRRLDGAYDPSQHVFSGIYADTTDLGLTNGGTDLNAGTNHISFDDDELPPAIPGPFGDPETIFVAASTARLRPGGRPIARWASLAMMWTRLWTRNRPAVARTSLPSSPVRLAAVTWAAQPMVTNSKRSSGRAAKPRFRSGWLMMGTKPRPRS